MYVQQYMQQQQHQRMQRITSAIGGSGNRGSQPSSRPDSGEGQHPPPLPADFYSAYGRQMSNSHQTNLHSAAGGASALQTVNSNNYNRNDSMGPSGGLPLRPPHSLKSVTLNMLGIASVHPRDRAPVLDLPLPFPSRA